MTRAMCWLMLAAMPCLAAPRDLLEDGSFRGATQAWNVRGNVTGKLVNEPAGGAPRYLSLAVRTEPGENRWASAITQVVGDYVGKGHRLELKLWARSPERLSVFPYLEINQEPFDKSLSQELKLTPEWREYTVTGVSLADYRPDETAFGFHLATGNGTIQLAGVRLMNLDAEGETGARATPDNPVSLLTSGNFESLDGWVGLSDRLKAEPIEVNVGGFSNGLRLTTDPPAGGQPWSVGFGKVSAAPCRRGDAVYFRAWMRSADKVPVDFIFELNAPPNTKEISQMVQLTPEWKEYRFAGRCRQPYEAGGAMIKFFLGRKPGVVEVAGIRCDNYGAATGYQFDETIDFWSGRPHDDAWRADAEARIEQIRKGDLNITVVDAAGKPVPNAQVQVEQQTHHFRFGTAAPAQRFLDDNPDNLKFRETVKELFNTVTFENDLKWAGEGEQRLQMVEQAIDWLHGNGIQVRGHCLVWGSYKHLPQRARELRGDALLQAIQAHVPEYAKRFDGKLYLWDVVNEAGSNTEIWDEVGWEQFANVFKLARQADPDVKLCYNDYGILAQDNPYKEKVAPRIQYLLDHGAPVDYLGLQAHMGTPLTPMPEIWKNLERWAAFGPRLEITEYDLSVKDDAAHAAWSTDFLTQVFSHPKVDAFIMWGFWAGSHWKGNDGGAMINRDWSWRPAAEQFKQKVYDEWWTQWDGQSDAAGKAKLRAFFGQQKVTVKVGETVAEATIDLVPGAAGAVTVRLP